LTPKRYTVEWQTSKRKTVKRKYAMFTLMTQEHENSIQELRTIESVAFAYKMGENGGFYKVQLIDENGVIVSEWK